MIFKTLKSKILTIAISTLAILLVAFACYADIFRVKTEQLMLQNYGLSLNNFVFDINQQISNLEDNSRDLALIGKLYYKTDRNPKLTEQAITRIFENYPESLGGGIWFEPYVIDKFQKRNCYYAFRNKQGEIQIDKNFASDEYDYHNQGWYKQISSQISKTNNTVWSHPYYEKQGSETTMITVGTGIFDGDKLIGISTVDWEISSIINNISQMKPIESGFKFFENRHKIKDSFAVFANVENDFIIASTDPYIDNKLLIGKSLLEIPWFNTELKKLTSITYHNRKYVPYVKTVHSGMVLIICIPQSEMYTDITHFVFNMVLVLLVLGIGLPLLLYWALNRYIMKPINKLTTIAHKISHGEDVEIKIEKPQEFEQLASTFDQMTKYIKSSAKEKERINSELAIAKTIQESSLPSVFPAFPDRKEFDIFASMDTAKEVGGDFYDFYFIDDNKLMFLIADVSGKGVPAALFMMTVKTLINNMALVGYSPKELAQIINDKICANNQQGFFVTMLAGIIDIKSGEISFINCGHNLPLIKRNNGDYEYLKLSSNIALGIFDNTDFEIFETVLNEGDTLFTYTDGITEATNNNNEMFGEERLKACLNKYGNFDKLSDISETVIKEVNDFRGEEPQSDDITMLIFKYKNDNTKPIKTYKTKAIQENYKPFYVWLEEVCKEWNLSEELTNRINMCAEEIFANVAFYAYPDEAGDIYVTIQKQENNIMLKFIDSGFGYNPLEKPDPDITLPPEERELGGLGIFMTKQMSKEIHYERQDHKNILTLILE